MGSNESKSEGQCVYSTPKRLQTPVDLVITVNSGDNACNFDPRSPHLCRTPIDNLLEKGAPVNQSYEMLRITSPNQFENPSDILRNKLIKELQHNLNDPRSPSQFINRTPIVFDESGHECLVITSDGEKSVCLDDKYPDLFMNSEYDHEKQGENLQEENNELESNERDPRSPSVDVERTPLIFPDDLHNESDAIESVLEALTLSAKTQNKALERLKNTKRTRSTNTNNGKKAIYEDNEQVYSTPKRVGGPYLKRTPLSCVANKSHLRSRSVENSNKSKRPKIPLTSYDDNALKHSKLEAIANCENIENGL